EAPALVEADAEVGKRGVELGDGRKEAQPEELFLEGADEALGATVALRRAHEGRARLEPEEADFALEILGGVDAAVIMPQPDSGGEILVGPAEDLGDGLAHRFERLEAAATGGAVKAQALARAVVNHHEDRRLALASHRRRAVGAPHLVGSFGGDLAVVGSWPAGCAGAAGREQVCLAHQAQHAGLRRAHALGPQLRPSLAVSFADPHRGREHLADPLEQLGVAVARLRAALTGRRGALAAITRRVHGRARYFPPATHASEPVGLSSRGGEGFAHRLRLGHKKGFSSSIRWQRSSSSSLAIVISPILARSRWISSSRSSAGRLFRLASPPARKWSRQLASVPAVTPMDRDTASSVSPRSTRSTASRFLRDENRPPSPRAA